MDTRQSVDKIFSPKTGQTVIAEKLGPIDGLPNNPIIAKVLYPDYWPVNCKILLHTYWDYRDNPQKPVSNFVAAMFYRGTKGTRIRECQILYNPETVYEDLARLTRELLWDTMYFTLKELKDERVDQLLERINIHFRE